MLKSFFICVIFAAALTACEQQQQAAAEVGAQPKQIIDQAADDLAKAQALAAEQRQTAEAAK
jgi:hypothetical protein